MDLLAKVFKWIIKRFKKKKQPLVMVEISLVINNIHKD